MNKPSVSKIVQIINYFASENLEKEISKLHVLKYIYLADRFHLRKYGRLITNDIYYAMQYGPVASCAKNIMSDSDSGCCEKDQSYVNEYIKVVDNKTIRALKSVDLSVFSETDKEALRSVLSLLRNKKIDPVEFTHRFPEWKKHERELSSKRLGRVKMNVVDFFESANKNDEYCLVDSELLDLNKEAFVEMEAVCN